MRRAHLVVVVTGTFVLLSSGALMTPAEAEQAQVLPQSTPAAAPPPAPGGYIRPPGGPGQAVESTSLENLLLEKGLITMDDWIRIKAEEERRTAKQSVVTEFTGSPRWYERLTQYGYGMFRYNRLGQPNGRLRNYQDASVGGENDGAQPGFFFRRTRWVVTGQVSDHVSVFVQPDLASNISGNTHALSMRDA